MSKKEEGEKNKNVRESVKQSLLLLQGKTFAQMDKAEQESFIEVLGKMFGLMDETGKVKNLEGI